MFDRKLLLNILLKKFGGLNIKKFTERLVLQKRIYLLQLFGIDLGYRYNWYIRGPYSPSLADDAFELELKKTEIDTSSSGFELTSSSKTRLKKYEKFEREIPQDEFEKYLEILASIHYLKHIGFVPDGVSKKNIKNALQNRGKNFSDEEVNRAWDLLNKYGLIQNLKLQ